MKGLIEEQKEVGQLVLWQGLCGVLVGIFLAAVMAAIAVPSFDNITMTHAQAAEFSRLARLAGFFSFFSWVGLFGLFAFLLASWVMSSRRVNPGLPGFPFFGAPKPFSIWTQVLLSGCVFQGGLVIFLDSGQWTFTHSGPAFFALAAAGGAAAWLILSPSKASAFLGAGFGLMAGFLFQATGKVFSFLFQWILEVGCPSFEMNFSQGLLVYSLPVAISAVFFAGCFGLVPAWSPDDSTLGARLRRAFLPVALLAAAGAWIFNLHRTAVSTHHWRVGSLAQAAGLPDRAAPVWTLVVLGADGKSEPTVQSWPAETRSRNGMPAVVPSTDANRRALEAFLVGPGRSSRFRRAAADVLSRMSEVLWDRKASLDAQEVVSYVFGSDILHRAFETAWLSGCAPITPANRERLERLSDEGRFRIHGRGALKMAKAWWRFGDKELARHWLAVVRLTYRDAKKDELALPEAAPFPDGSVSGRVVFDGKPLAGAMVGVFRIPDEVRVLDVSRLGLFWTQQADARRAGADGSFRFERLTEGAYGLCLLTPPGKIPAKAKLKASKLPGVVKLSRGSARADLGLLSLTTGR
ncbi:MAG: hypothetical protein HZB91_00985 [Elusimicrobia bacterium]|nr:hypothetical protein [Elusimicrobiota bacterium]